MGTRFDQNQYGSYAPYEGQGYGYNPGPPPQNDGRSSMNAGYEGQRPSNGPPGPASQYQQYQQQGGPYGQGPPLQYQQQPGSHGMGSGPAQPQYQDIPGPPQQQPVQYMGGPPPPQQQGQYMEQQGQYMSPPQGQQYQQPPPQQAQGQGQYMGGGPPQHYQQQQQYPQQQSFNSGPAPQQYRQQQQPTYLTGGDPPPQYQNQPPSPDMGPTSAPQYQQQQQQQGYGMGNVNYSPQQQQQQQGYSRSPSQQRSQASPPRYYQQSSFGGPGGNGPPPHVYAAAAAPRAGQYQPGRQGEIPRMGRGIYNGLGSITVTQGGLAPSQSSPKSPTGLGMAGSRPAEQLSVFQTGIAPAGAVKKDNVATFEGYYSKAHAGKMSASSLGSGQTGIMAPTSPLDALPHMKQFDRVGHVSQLQPHEGAGLAASPAGDKGKVENFSGIRILHGAPQTQDHLTNSPAGLTSPDIGAPKMYLHAGKASESSIKVMAQGMSHSNAEKGYPSSNLPRGGRANEGVLIQKEHGIVQQGETYRAAGPYAGRNAASHLEHGANGIQMRAPPGGGAYQPIAHAGKITASNIVMNTNGMTVMPNDVARNPSGGQAHWATTYDDTYHYLQVGQLQLKQQQKLNKPDFF
mmetsp:Transcript_9616/g.20493  ORF Transcript_9616/g.20493 Transcript_9616/m.20493 type:complete len:627 (-) Transcript_9616:318-2198(-)|eukprot:CAMPEP_0202899328 /NCGR_PEP_ID=MMETSP1392-20130828/7599_1 /ASSEMBLY_ACC=CAM_ASM_000868 /TAXON_ID=225041 /ORGANISM="Chlamydomonas chlamydogama, Strain SAG 11-48b" /LENGTH=626 /DNA_ID=CAMNT_0049585489 /DNA_START=143 /DNA_END=2023 /DNA_ORIENTATION=-